MGEKELREQQIDEQKNVTPVVGRKRRSKKRLLLLLLLLLMTGVMLSTSTYAWFTSNRTVTVEDINVNVSAGGGIQVSVDGTSWKSIITNDDLKAAINTYGAATNQIPTELKPVSTAAKSLNNGYLSMWLGTVETSETTANKGQYIITTTDVSTVKDSSLAEPGANAGVNGHFVAFDLFLRLDEKGTDAVPIYLTKSSDVVANGADLGTQNSARVAFINEGSVASGSELATIQALTTSDTSNIKIWEPNFDKHTATGLSNAYTYYNTANNGNAYTVASAGTQVPYFGTISEVTTSDDIILSKANATDGLVDGAAAFASVTPGITTPAGWANETSYKELFKLTPQTITKVRIYFWVEGQDIDCENNASGGAITLKLSFSLNDKDQA